MQQGELFFINDIMSTLVVSIPFIFKSSHVLSHGHPLLFSLHVKFFLNDVKVPLCSVAGFSEGLNLLLALLQVTTIRQYLILYFLTLWECLELNEGCLAINRLAFLLTLLLDTKLLKLLLRVLLGILCLRTRFVVISLHAKDLFLSLLANFNFINRP